MVFFFYYYLDHHCNRMPPTPIKFWLHSPFGGGNAKKSSLQTKPGRAQVQSMLNEEKMSRTQSNCLFGSLRSHRCLNLSFVLVVLVALILFEMDLFLLVCKEH